MRGPLIERDDEAAEIHRVLSGAATGDGCLLLLEGPAGIGKTALLVEARERARGSGLTVLMARGAELELGFAYGVVRQLFETTVQGASPGGRDRLLAGAAARAARVVVGVEEVGVDPIDQISSMAHALYWLVGNLAAESPLALLVDDAHWADPPSLRFLAYLARRLEGLPIALIVAVRTGETRTDQVAVGELESVPGARSLRPDALSREGATAMLATEFGQAPEPDFVGACHDVTGGNPFFLRELARALRADGVEPKADALDHILRAGPKAIARVTLARLARLSLPAFELARAIAVLSPDARPEVAAALAGLNDADVAAAIDALRQADVIAADALSASGQLEFSHPIVRTAIYQDVAPGTRSIAHRDAAALLSGAGASPDLVAAHLVLTEPIGAIETIRVLREAAHRAVEVGAPDSAAVYLARALAEGPQRSLRTTVLLELGQAEILSGGPAAVEHLDEVRRIAAEPATRAAAALDQAKVLYYAAPGEAVVRIDAALGDLPESDHALRMRIEAMRAAPLMYDPDHVAAFIDHLPVFTELALSGQPGSRPLLALLGSWHALREGSRSDVLALGRRAWDGGRYLEDGDDLEVLPQVLGPFIVWDELDFASEITSRLRSSAAQTGSVMQHLIASAHDAYIEARRGNLDAAASELRASFDLAVELRQQFAALSTLWYCLDVLLERPDAADLAAVVESFDIGPAARMYGGAVFVGARGQLRFAAGDRAGALADVRHLQRVEGALGITRPWMSWRPALAAMLPVAERKEALALAQTELESARRMGNPRRLGVALRALGTVENERAAVLTHLEESVDVLAGSPARLDLARSLVALGAARRRFGERAAARGPLQDGLELAMDCGAMVTADRARSELAVAGISVDPARVEGPGALTASERRVAQMAADGMTSRQIAQALFIAARTVDSHLGRIYAKLSITSRRQLAGALDK